MELLDGKYIANGEKNLYVKISGCGNIPVVIETDWGGLSIEWNEIQRELSKHTTVISYDRAGYGESPASGFGRSSTQIAGELFMMLKNSGIPGPYVLAGHGAGGLYIQNYAKMFANEIAGMVLIDSMTIYDDEFDKLDTPEYHKLMSHNIIIENIRKEANMGREEFEKMLIPYLSKIYEGFDEVFKQYLITYQTDQTFYKTILREMEARNESIQQVKQLSIFTNIPVKVLCHDPSIWIDISNDLGIPENESRMIEELWLRNSKDLLNLSTESEFEIVEGSSHKVHLDKPEVIVNAILDVVKRADID